MKRLVLGITGGIGSGKSAVSRLLASYCLAPFIDLDQCCRTLLEPEQPGWHALKKRFGDCYFDGQEMVNRPKLREALFADQAFRQEIDALLHPLAQDVMRAELARHAAPLLCVEIPLLYEAGWQAEVDAVLVVYARPGVRCCRIMQRDGVTRRQAAQAMAAQLALEEKARLADYVVNNSGPWRATRDQVIALGNLLSC